MIFVWDYDERTLLEQGLWGVFGYNGVYPYPQIAENLAYCVDGYTITPYMYVFKDVV